MDRMHEVAGSTDVAASDDLYRLVDFLNRILKDRDLIVGLAKSQQDKDHMTITVYRTDVCGPK
jgi:hypothetical protein